MHCPYWLGIALIASLAPLPAQIGPGGYPPGQYPPGYPGTGGIGFPVPHRGKKGKSTKETEPVNLQSTDGMLRRIETKQVILEADDSRMLNFKRSDHTKFLKNGDEIKPSELRPGDHVTIEASQDEEGFLSAVNVLWQQDGTAAEREHAAAEVETSLAKSSDEQERPVQRRAGASPKTPETPTAKKEEAPNSSAPAAKTEAAPEESSPADLGAPVKDPVPAARIDADDDGPPVLKRGGKTVKRKPAEAPPPGQAPEPGLSARNEPPAQPAAEEEREPASVETKTAQRPEEVALEKAREEAAAFVGSLPDYVCQELMTRYVSTTHIVSWQPQDVVSTELVYEKGKESYRNVAINGKLTKKSIEELPGAWSTGEFGTVLADVFSPGTAANFQYRRESRSGGRDSLVYDFSVDRQHSHWRIMVASQLVKPAYKGSVWIDKETKRVLRIEMQASRIPEAFPSDKVETATDYQYVRFAGRQFLVPVHAETLMCERGTDNCSRNTIDFRNYHKFAGESTITFQK